MPVIGSPVACKAPSTNNRINLKQYMAVATTANIGRLDALVSPSAPNKSIRVSSVKIAASAITSMKFAATLPSPLTVSSVNIVTNVITTNVAHGLVTGQLITLGGSAAPTGTVFNTPYFVKVLTATTFEIYATVLAAITGTSKIIISGTGTSVTIPNIGWQLDSISLIANSTSSAHVPLDGSFQYQLPAGFLLSMWCDVALDLFRFTLYEV
jgi:hypothetical protein